MSLPQILSPLDWPAYAWTQAEKRARLLPALQALTKHHASHCMAYARVLSAHGVQEPYGDSLEQLPYLPVRLFKHYELRSVPEAQVFKTLTSSGTSGQAPSRILLDKLTAQRQTTALVRLLQDFIGKARLPMLILDHPGVVRDRHAFSARGAGILGLSNFGRGHVYALDDNLQLNLPAVRAFAEQHQGATKLLFGFTFMVWQHVVRALEAQEQRINLDGSILLHSGGWKKLQDQAVDTVEFKRRVKAVLAVDRVHNFYGMVEQVGSVFVECSQGHLHAPAFAEVVVREPGSWRPLQAGQEGVLQVLSCLPHSYPGHSLLTEDLGRLLGEDDCPCGRRGRYFEVLGRVPQAEIRGCSDVMPDTPHQR